MFVALYRWKLREGRETEFQEAWARVTEALHDRRGSLGSRLHRAEDGTWVAYAQWPDRQTYDASRAAEAVDPEARRVMREGIETSFPDTYLEVVDDRLRPKP